MSKLAVSARNYFGQCPQRAEANGDVLQALKENRHSTNNTSALRRHGPKKVLAEKYGMHCEEGVRAGSRIKTEATGLLNKWPCRTFLGANP
eukprot:6184300-Pleurochrysis_carterae.AAC.5